MKKHIFVLSQFTITVWLMIFLPTYTAAQVAMDKQQREIQQSIAELYKTPEQVILSGNTGASFFWVIFLTEPMKRLIQLGPAAQNILLQKLSDPAIKDQVMITLGAMGDEQVIEPIIKAMIGKDEIKAAKNALNINLCANLALTNITFADVIWPYGRYPAYIEKCQTNAKECWLEWWEMNKQSFSIKRVTRKKVFEFYPNYGLYTITQKFP